MKNVLLEEIEGELVQPENGASTSTARPGNAAGILTEYNEAAAVALALKSMPPLKTVGDTWREYRAGAWRLTDFNGFRPAVLSVMADAIVSHRRSLDVLRHIEGLKQVAESDFRSFYRFDGDAVLVNAVNGIVRVEPDYQVELLAHDPGHNFTRQLEAAYIPQAPRPNFERVLAEALPDGEDRALLQLFAGSLLYPSCKYEAALVFYGPGGTGKSTVAEAIASIFGTELVERIGLSSICDAKTYYLPKLKHVAVNLGTELDALEVGESGNFKALVSGEAVAVRPIYGAPFTMSTTAKLWFLSNNLPRFKHGTDAEQRRTRFLRFDKVPAVKDVDLKQRLIAERDGIVLWCLEGLSRLLSLREMPLGGAESKATHERFAVSNDPIGTFIATRCRFDCAAHVSKEHFQAALVEYCEANAITCDDTRWIFRQLWDRYPQLKDARLTDGDSRIRVIKGLVLA
jgi:P4 family phage/plasmid primase-like protien